jgi:mannose-6-phosphate isomerase-like protein (cupin superfamily)
VSWTLVNLGDVEDQAAKHGFGEFQEARFPRRELGTEQTGLGHIVVKPGKRQPFSHRHGEAEELYVVLSGSGVLKLDDEVVEVGPRDVVRIGPGVAHGMEAGPGGLEILAFGPHVDDDAEMIEGLWEDPEG